MAADEARTAHDQERLVSAIHRIVLSYSTMTKKSPAIRRQSVRSHQVTI
jgi:hypothetical protein